jgi:PAS domain S-box-containing protein
MKDYNEQLVTKLEQQAAEATAAEAKFRALLEQSLVGIYVIQDDRFVYVNRKMTEIFGASVVELTSRPVYDFIAPEDRALARENVRRRISGEAMSIRYDLRMLHQSGAVVETEVHGTRAEYDGRPAIIGALLDVTERKQAEEALQASEAEFRASFYSAAVGKAQVHPTTGRYLRVNSKFCELTGYSEDELRQMTFLEVTHPEDREDDSASHRRMVGGELPELCREKRYVRKDGGIVWVNVNASVIRDDAGRPLRTLAVVQDITARKEAEAARRSAEAKFRILVEQSLVGIYVIQNEKFVYVNPKMPEIFGNSAEELCARPFYEFVVTEDRALTRANVRKRVEGRVQSIRYTARILHGSGQVHYVEVHGSRTDYEGRPAVMGTMLDITERKHAEDQLRLAHEQLRHLLEHSPAVTYSLKVESKHLVPHLISENITRLLGFTVEESHHIDWWVEHLHPEDRERAMASVPETLESRVVNLDYRLRHKDGTYLWVQDNRRLVRDDAGQPQEIAGVWTDITEKKELEAKFLRAQRLESIGALASGIAHDLNNALTPILMGVGFLRATAGGEENRRMLESMENSARRGADMVKQVLAFARGLSGTQAELALQESIQEIGKIATDTFPNRIRIQVKVAPDLWTVSGDATQLHQVLMNLCVNARDAMPEGGQLVLAADNLMIDEALLPSFPEAKAGPHVVVTVEDSGLGIPAENLPRIFEPFFTTKELGKGTGLGLSTSVGIVRSHGGFMTVGSRVGAGTKFNIYLPAITTANGEEAATQKPAAPLGRSELILVAEDEASIRHITKTALEAHGYRVITAGDGAETVALFAQHAKEIDLVVTDLSMPYMDGPAAIRAMRHIEPLVKIVATSGLGSHDKAGEVRQVEALALLRKPFSVEQLLHTVHGALHPG